MRVVVHHPARTEEDGTEVPESTSAYKLGRITDETGVNHFTGETLTKEQQATILKTQAEAEYPGQAVEIEVLVHNQDGEGEDGLEGGTSRWVHHTQVPEGAISPKGGPIHVQELSATQGQEVQS